MIRNFFYQILYRPLFNLLVFLYQNVSFLDLGVAIILLTVIIRFILYPLFSKMAKDQAIMQKIGPKIQEIQQKHKDDRQKQAQEMMNIYKEHKINPFSSFFYLLVIQLPILIALYRIFIDVINKFPVDALYPSVQFAGNLNTNFLGILDLTASSIVITLLAAAAQYAQGKLTEPKTKKAFKNMSQQEKMAKQMTFIGPAITLVILFNLPAALGLYWLTSNIFSVIQQIVINRKIRGAGLAEMEK